MGASSFVQTTSIPAQEAMLMMASGAIHKRGTGEAEPAYLEKERMAHTFDGIFYEGGDFIAQLNQDSWFKQPAEGQPPDLTSVDFGALREAAKQVHAKNVSGSYVGGAVENVDTGDLQHSNYYTGPWLWAGKQAKVLAEGIAAETADPVGSPVSNIGSYLAKLSDASAVSAMDTILSKPLDGDAESYYKAIVTAITEGLAFNQTARTDLSWTAYAFTKPTLSAMSEYGNSTAVSATTITEPTAVTVSAQVDAAIAAHESMMRTRHAADEAALIRSYSGTRRIMSSSYDKALALLRAKHSAELAEYAAQARLHQTDLQVSADEEHQRLLLDVRKTNAANALEASRTTVDNALRAHSMNQEIKKSVHDIERSYAELNMQGAIAFREANIKTESSVMEEAVRVMEARLGVVHEIFGTCISWMGNAAGMTNAAADAEIKRSQMNATIPSGLRGQRIDNATKMAALYEGAGQLYWRSMMQNMEVLRAGTSMFTGVGGSQTAPSPFQVAGQALSGGVGLVAQVAQIVSLL